MSNMSRNCNSTNSNQVKVIIIDIYFESREAENFFSNIVISSIGTVDRAPLMEVRREFCERFDVKKWIRDSAGDTKAH